MTKPKIDTTVLDHVDALLVQHDIHQAWWRLETMQDALRTLVEEEYHGYFDHPIAKPRIAAIVDAEDIKDALWYLQRALTWLQQSKRRVDEGHSSKRCIHFNEDGDRRTREEVHALIRAQCQNDSAF